MSADYDRLFHSPDTPRTVEDVVEHDIPPIGLDIALMSDGPLGSDATASPLAVATRPRTHTVTPPPRQSEITSEIPPTRVQAPRDVPNNGMLRASHTLLSNDVRCQQRRPAAAVEPVVGPPRHAVDTAEAQASTAQPTPSSATSVQPTTTTTGNHRTIDALAHVGVRSAVKMPPQRGWRHWVYVLTRINLGLSPDELYEMDLHQRIRRNARDSYQIGVIGLKGGVGKTALTVALGSALSRIRGDRILAIDADPDGGNLADRVGRQSAATIADLLADTEVHRYNDIRAYTSMNGSNLEVLSSEDYSSARREFDDEDWQGATQVASRYYNLVLADCGASLFQPAARGVLSTASGLVIVASAAIDGARQAAITMDWLRHNGYQDLLGRSCVVINHVVPGRPSVDVADLVQQFERHVPPGRVVVLPWDRHIAAGTEVQFGLLGRGFQRKVVELAAALSDDFDRLERR